MYRIEKFQGYTFGVSDALLNLAKTEVIQLMQTPYEHSKQVLSGRGVVNYGVIPNLGAVVIKQYHRGGLLGKVNKSKYIKLLKYRPAEEFRLLEIARKAGANVPEPLAWIVKGRGIYTGWLLMREIEYSYNLAEAGKLADQHLLPTLTAFAEQVECLIRARIYHLDLHPGNVLVDRAGKVHLIDFDKASIFKGSLTELRDRYLLRWRRAVIKHHLPDLLSEKVCGILRANFSCRAV